MATIYAWSLYLESTPHSELTVPVKPIFHCDAKLLASGNFALPNAKDCTFALPNTKNTNMLVSLALGDANFLALAMYISFFVCRFHLDWVANANPISSGI